MSTKVEQVSALLDPMEGTDSTKRVRAEEHESNPGLIADVGLLIGGAGQGDGDETLAGGEAPGSDPAPAATQKAADDDEGPDPDPDPDPGEPEAAPGPLTAKEAAERLGISEEEFESAISAMGFELDGARVTLEDLTGRAKRAGDLDERTRVQELLELEQDERTHTKQLELGRAHDDAARMYEMLSDAGVLTPGMEQELTRQRTQTSAREWDYLTAKWPEIAEPAAFQAEKTRIANRAGAYGYSSAEIESINDHRAFLVLRRLADLEDRLDSARAELKARKKTDTRRAASVGSKEPGSLSASSGRNSGKAGRRSDQIGRVAAIINSG